MKDFLKKLPKVFWLGACCALGGVALGFYAGRAREAANVAVVTTNRTGASEAGTRANDAHGARQENLSGAASLKTPAQWRGFIERWMAAGCPTDKLPDVRKCLGQWARVDVMGALEFVHGAARFPERRDAYALVLSVLCETDVSRAIEWMRQNLPAHARTREDVAGLVVDSLREKFPRQAAELMLASDVVGASSYRYGYVVTALMRQNPADALAFFERIPQGEKQASVSHMLEAWVATNPAAALNWCASQRGTPLEKQSLDALLDAFAKNKPSELPALVERFGVDVSGYSYHYMIENVIRSDPSAGLELLKKLPADKIEEHMPQLMSELFKADPDKALEAAAQFLPASDQAGFLLTQWEKWRQSDRKAANEWLAALPDETLRGQMQTLQSLNADPSAYLASVAPVAPAGAGAGADAGARDAFSEECVSRALGYLAFTKGSDEAMRWLLAHPEQITERRFALAADNNAPSMTLEAIDAIPVESARGVVLEHMTDSWISTGNWEQAAAAISRFQDTERQEQLRFAIFSGMMNRAETDDAKQTARQWLAAQPLPETVCASWKLLVEGGAKLPPCATAPQELKSAPLKKEQDDSASISVRIQWFQDK